ncbi:hypothetical protein Q5752_006870 [Cryptotrichosporon argae]
MPFPTVIAATVSQQHAPSAPASDYRGYGAVSGFTGMHQPQPGPSSAYAPRRGRGFDGRVKVSYDDEYDEDSEGEDDGVPVVDVSWRYLSRLYLVVPVVTLVFFALLILLVAFAWPPSDAERKAGQKYPHPLLWKPFFIGLTTSITVQSLRVPCWVVVSWLPLSDSWTSYVSTVVHTTLHEVLRLAALTVTLASPTSGFHSSYYLALGFGAAEAAWGIVQGWEQLALYEDVLSGRVEDNEYAGESGWDGLSVVPEDPERGESAIGLVLGTPAGARDRNEPRVIDEQAEREADEAELERKVGILERMRARHDLEQAIGLPFPNIPLPLHLLWRLDTLLLNLGLTLLLSAYYYNSYPIYRHAFPSSPAASLSAASAANAGLGLGLGPGLSVAAYRDGPAAHPSEPSPWLPTVWLAVCALHVAVSLVWKFVGRLGVGAVTWGGLIVALGSVFAGLGAWGGLV